KDLGKFLTRELDFYIKNEVMHLDDVESETAPRVEQYLSKIKVIRRLGGKIIDFLKQLEDFQKKLWLKKKFVVETHYSIPLGRIPEEFYPEIASNEAQRDEWVKLCSIDEDSLTRGYTVPLTVEFLKSYPSLMLDTRNFSQEFSARLLESFDNIGELTDGLLVHSENFQALSLLEKSYRGRVKCVYIDPPYNSKTSEIAYKNNYKHSSWVALMDNRLEISRELMTNDGSHIVAIDENEQEILGSLLAMHFPNYEKICVTVIHNKKGIQGDYFSYNHDYAYFCISPDLPETHGTAVLEEDWDYTNLRKWGRESERSSAKNCFYPIYVENGVITGFGDVAADGFHPGRSNIAENGRVAVYPVDPEGIERKWRYARGSVEAILPLLEAYTTRKGEIQIRKAVSERTPKTVWDDSKYIAGDYGTKWLTDLGVKISEDVYPKSIHTVEDSVFAVTDSSSVVMDYFGGTGTTGHAVLNLNRQGGRRKFVVVEMSHYFDTILLPRIKKVTFSPEWKNGKPKRVASRTEFERGPNIIKVIRLESYEDSLNNLQTERSSTQQLLLDSPETHGPGGLKEEYLLKYALHVETQGSLLDTRAFADPNAYRLKVKQPGSDESKELCVDLIETFNWLIGLTPSHISAPQRFAAEFERDAEGRLRIRGELKRSDDGRFWFRTVAGTAPDGSKNLVLWRKLTGTPEEDNLVLDEWFNTQGYSTRANEFEVIYVNGTNNLENLRLPSDTWKVRLIEEHFHRTMFEDV
ncbi:MAG TPA: DNA methyltransferase, partial [Pyrinomonadaceae bacterium]|nr:DNA methyltransferase [Pyrinomonadaceae bacterium]